MSRSSTVRRLSVAYLLSLGWQLSDRLGCLCCTRASGGLIVRLNGRDFACYSVSPGEWSCSLYGEYLDEHATGVCTIGVRSLRGVYTRK